MDVYILNSKFERVELVDDFESMIWTERFYDIGDFELMVHYNQGNKARFIVGTYLMVNGSYRVGQIKKVNDLTDDEGRVHLIITGVHIENILKDRAALNTLSSNEWRIKGRPAVVARQIFDRVCRTGGVTTRDRIPYLVEGSAGSWGESLPWSDANWTWESTGGSWMVSMYPQDTIPEPTETITYEVPKKSVYEVLKELCQTYNLGFRLVRTLDETGLYFQIYSGSYRTAGQNTYAPVKFSEALDSLSNASEVVSDEDEKNVCYVVSPKGTRTVYSEGTPSTVSGMDRKAMILEVSEADVDADVEDGVTIAQSLDRRGKAALAEFRPTHAFDGEAMQNGVYVHGRDYYLGDIVEMETREGLVMQMRVTEHIRVSDIEGEKSYPTLVDHLMIQTGSWTSWIGQTSWDETAGTWASI